jgi:hypothetical protein
MTREEWEKLRPSERKQIERRQELWRTALEDALIFGDRLRIALRDGKGVWWDSMAPLTAEERTLVLRELRSIWKLPPEKQHRSRIVRA